jgi:hypothetical protein
MASGYHFVITYFAIVCHPASDSCLVGRIDGKIHRTVAGQSGSAVNMRAASAGFDEKGLHGDR